MEMAATAAKNKKARDKSSVVKSSIFIVWLTVDFAVSVCWVESFKPRQRWATAIEEQTGEEMAVFEWMNKRRIRYETTAVVKEETITPN